MKTLVKKMSNLGLLKIQMIIGTIVMAAAIIGLPVSMIIIDINLMAEPLTWGIIAIGTAFFALVAFVCFIRPYRLYLETPDILVEADSKFIYIHGKKEAKIPLAELWNTEVQVDLPYIYQKEFIEDFIVHMFSEKYGDICLDIPAHRTYKLRFVSNVQKTADELVRFLDVAVPNAAAEQE